MQEKLEKIDFFYRDKKKICFHKKRHFSADFFKKEKKLSEQNRRFVIREKKFLKLLTFFQVSCLSFKELIAPFTYFKYTTLKTEFSLLPTLQCRNFSINIEVDRKCRYRKFILLYCWLQNYKCFF